MGCLNSTGSFSHWFGNIHFSGPCNRSCYFCIGQHMMALDPFNNLDRWPLGGMDDFVSECRKHCVRDINLTGTNTDPLLYRHVPELLALLRGELPNVALGCRTNGVRVLGMLDVWALFDKASISIPSLDAAVYYQCMGGTVPDLATIMARTPFADLKINVVLGPYNTPMLSETLNAFEAMGVQRVNLREPYGQPHVGDPLAEIGERNGTLLGMPTYRWGEMAVTYWDVHYVEVESVNLYANGRVSVDYPITRGHDSVTGDVKDQGHFPTAGRVREQWLTA